MGRTRERIIAEARAEKAGWLAGRYGWTQEQIDAYLAGITWTGWLPPWWVYADTFHPMPPLPKPPAAAA
jgi:hypothetical protein